MGSNSELDGDFYEEYPVADDLVKLSHLNTKSSVLAPDCQDITSQYLVLQQLNAHQHMVSRARSTVDTSAPKSLQSYISATDRLKKKSWQKPNNSRTNMDDFYARASASSRLQASLSGEDDNMSSTSSLNKGVQTGILRADSTCRTADKISWYLEALSQGGLNALSTPFGDPKNASGVSQHSLRSDRTCRRVVRGDLIEWHKDSFVQSGKPFSPRILADSTSKSKIRDMRCYNPPFRRKNTGSSHSSDTFESYDQQDESDDEKSEVEKSSTSSSMEEEARPKRATRGSGDAHQTPSASAVFPHRDPYLDSFERLKFLRRRNENESFHVDSELEEDKYLNFLSKVTEDILRSGVYSDQAIKQAFDFHMQFHQDDDNKEKFHALFNQVLSTLKVSSEDSEEISNRRNPLFMNFGRPDSPPEKESPDIPPSGDNPFTIDVDLNVNGQPSNVSSTEHPNNSPQHKLNTLNTNES